MGPIPTAISRAAQLGGLILVAALPSRANLAQEQSPQNELALNVGRWLGDDFIQRSIEGDDPSVGTVEFGSLLTQDRAINRLRVLSRGMFLYWLTTAVTV